MADIISFSYGETYLVEDDFDLNTLRKLLKVRSVDNTYIKNTDNQSISVIINAQIELDASKSIEVERSHSESEAKRNYKWYEEEKEKVDALTAENKFIKEQLNKNDNI